MRAQINLEFLLVLIVFLFLLFAVFHTYQEKVSLWRQEQAQLSLQKSVQTTANAINSFVLFPEKGKEELALPNGDYVLSLKQRRLEADAFSLEASAPLLTDAVRVPELRGGDKVTIYQEQGEIIVEKRP